MVNSRTDYSNLATEAARRVMLELVRILGEYRDDMVVVGGWIPELLFAKANPPHVGFDSCWERFSFQNQACPCRPENGQNRAKHYSITTLPRHNVSLLRKI